MSASKTAKQYAKMICDYMQKMPDYYADDPQEVQDALGLSADEFKLGLEWCIERKIITLSKDGAQENVNDSSAGSRAEAAESAASKEASTAEVPAVQASAEPAVEEETSESPAIQVFTGDEDESAELAVA
ncbi:MAG: hypothetical protein JNJ61_08180 [Anaerolineae bacterium]|nr:hypothetical protein [Anaerolineae bacterium]